MTEEKLNELIKSVLNSNMDETTKIELIKQLCKKEIIQYTPYYYPWYPTGTGINPIITY